MDSVGGERGEESRAPLRFLVWLSGWAGTPQTETETENAVVKAELIGSNRG